MNRLERAYAVPPLSWAVAANQWLADRLIRPWLEPILRPWERRTARRRIVELTELRVMLNGRAGAEKLDEAIVAWTRRLADLA